MHERIDQLEKLVTTLMDAKRNDASSEQTPFSAPVPSYTPTLSEDTIDPDIPGAADRVKLDNEETSYTDPGHWTSILDGVRTRQELRSVSLLILGHRSQSFGSLSIRFALPHKHFTQRM